MQEDGWVGRTITLKYKLDTYRGLHYTAARFQRGMLINLTVFTRAKSVDHWVSKKEELYAVR